MICIYFILIVSAPAFANVFGLFGKSSTEKKPLDELDGDRRSISRTSQRNETYFDNITNDDIVAYNRLKNKFENSASRRDNTDFSWLHKLFQSIQTTQSSTVTLTSTQQSTRAAYEKGIHRKPKPVKPKHAKLRSGFGSDGFSQQEFTKSYKGRPYSDYTGKKNRIVRTKDKIIPEGALNSTNRPNSKDAHIVNMELCDHKAKKNEKQLVLRVMVRQQDIIGLEHALGKKLDDYFFNP